MDAGRRMDVDEEAYDAARSKAKAAQISATVHVPRHSQEAKTNSVMALAVPYA